MGNCCKKKKPVKRYPFKDADKVQHVEEKPQDHVEENQAKDIVEEKTDKEVESPVVVEQEISEKEIPPPDKEHIPSLQEKTKTKVENVLKENVLVSKLRSMPSSNLISSENIEIPSGPYETHSTIKKEHEIMVCDIQLKETKEITTVTKDNVPEIREIKKHTRTIENREIMVTNIQSSNNGQ